LGYAEQAAKDYNDVLKTLAEENEDTEQTDDSARFQTYWNRFSTLPSEIITPTAVTISHSIAREGLSIGPHRMSAFEVCFRLYPNDPKKLIECLKTQS